MHSGAAPKHSRPNPSLPPTPDPAIPVHASTWVATAYAVVISGAFLFGNGNPTMPSPSKFLLTQLEGAGVALATVYFCFHWHFALVAPRTPLAARWLSLIGVFWAVPMHIGVLIAVFVMAQRGFTGQPKQLIYVALTAAATYIVLLAIRSQKSTWVRKWVDFTLFHAVLFILLVLSGVTATLPH